ncbi:hypothetical protein TVAG_449520, partial [Trichomonas vaginalis G3]
MAPPRFCFTLYNVGPTEYLLERQKLLLPAKSTLYRAFGSDVNIWKQLVLSESPEIPILQKFLKFYDNLSSKSSFTIGIDAISGKLWKENTNSKKIQDLFAIYLMPLNFEGPNVCVHIIENTNGRAASVLEKILNYIELLQRKTQVPFVTTDGDKSYDAIYIVYFNHWFFLITDFNGLVNEMRNAKYKDIHIIFIADVVHIGKNLRTLIVFDGKLILMQPYDPTRHVDIEKIRQYCHIGDAINNKDKSSKLNDKYPVTLFNVNNVWELLKHGCFEEGVWLLPLTLWFEAIRNLQLPVEARMSMIKLAFYILQFYLRLAHALKISDRLKDVVNNDGTIKFKAYFFSRIIHMKKMATSLLIIYGILDQDPSINFQHITTLPVEHLFALFRKFAKAKKEVNDLMSACAHQLMTEYYNLGHFNRLVKQTILDQSGADLQKINVISEEQWPKYIFTDDEIEQITTDLLYSVGWTEDDVLS